MKKALKRIGTPEKGLNEKIGIPFEKKWKQIGNLYNMPKKRIGIPLKRPWKASSLGLKLHLAVGLPAQRAAATASLLSNLGSGNFQKDTFLKGYTFVIFFQRLCRGVPILFVKVLLLGIPIPFSILKGFLSFSCKAFLKENYIYIIIYHSPLGMAKQKVKTVPLS